MPKCCIVDCDTHNLKNTDHIAYFKFPLHDDELLAKWLRKIPRQPEGWRPSDKTFICSWHFRSKDIDRNPKRDFLLLRANAAPTIFKRSTTNHRPWPIIIQDQVKKIVSVPAEPVAPQVIQATPIILAESVADTTEDVNEDVTGNKFRKILPRTSNAVTQLLVPTEGTTSGNSYFLLVPTYENLPVSTPKIVPSPSLPGQKAVLTIKVARKMPEDPLEEVGSEKDMVVSDNNVNDCENDGGNHSEDEQDVEELVVYSKVYKKYVVFTLDPKTNEIVVSRRKNRKANNNEKTDDDEPAVKKAKINAEADLNENESLSSLKDKYDKAQHESSILRSQLQDLRGKCKIEKDTVVQLQDQLKNIEKNNGNNVKAMEVDDDKSDIVNCNGKKLHLRENNVTLIKDTIDEDLERMMGDEKKM